MANEDNEIKNSNNKLNNSDNGNKKGDESQSFYTKKRIIIPFIVIAIAAVFAWRWYQAQLGFVSTDDAFIDADKLTVSSKILGRIISLNFDEGDTVKISDVFATLDSTDMYAQKNESEALLSASRENINLEKVNLEKAQEDFNRAELQYESNIISKEKFDNARHALDQAKAKYELAKSNLKTSTARLNVIKTQLTNTVISSPINGVIGKRWVLRGDVVQPGQPIYTVFDVNNVWVTADLEETKLASIQNGNKVQITVDTYPDQKFAGEVYLMGSNTASQFSLIPPANASGNFTKITQRVPIRISIYPVDENGNQVHDKNIRLLPGMSVEIKIKLEN
ncbi:MAG: HlyD family secretion protein [Ignavibacteriaceae bacterium]|jgi:membrane fusion protein (multidrug efflux system)|nr:HlyD family secretion protein [Ignavibacteriaceae bacterium]